MTEKAAISPAILKIYSYTEKDNFQGNEYNPSQT